MNSADIESQLQLHDVAYYTHDAPTISDVEYDALKASWEAATGRLWEVLGTSTKLFTRIPHRTPMLSLGKVFTISELVKWLPDATAVYAVQPKIDGLAVSLHYRNGLCDAVSRGDGTVGESVSHSLAPIIQTGPKHTGHIPFAIAGEYGLDSEVRGEVYIPKDLFVKVGGQNPRNSGAGLVRKLEYDPRQQHLRFVAYRFVDHAYTGLGGDYKTHLGVLKGAGFQTPPTLFLTGAEIGKLIMETSHPSQLWPDLPYETDGLVISLVDLAAREALGETGHHPRWACALKFPTEEVETIYLGTEWKAGRTGTITPTHVITAVRLCGTTVSRATGHNLKAYLELGAEPGDTVRVRKSGEIIPEILRVTKKGNTHGQA
jgi:DNA ligase (NAD+)